MDQAYWARVCVLCHGNEVRGTQFRTGYNPILYPDMFPAHTMCTSNFSVYKDYVCVLVCTITKIDFER